MYFDTHYNNKLFLGVPWHFSMGHWFPLFLTTMSQSHPTHVTITQQRSMVMAVVNNLKSVTSPLFCFLNFVGPRSIFWGHWYPLFWTSEDSEFQSQGGSVVACALLSLVLNDPQSHLCLLGPCIEPGSLAPEVSIIPLYQPNLA